MATRTIAGEFPKDWFFEDIGAKAGLTGKPAPALNLSGWINGEVKPDDMKGKVVVVDLWATWCGPCVASIPHNNEVYAKYKDKGLVIIGVCTSGGGQEKFESVAKARKIAYPAAKDPELKTEKDWKVEFYPTYGVIDRKGVLRALGLSPDGMEKVVEKLIAESAEEKK